MKSVSTNVTSIVACTDIVLIFLFVHSENIGEHARTSAEREKEK